MLCATTGVTLINAIAPVTLPIKLAFAQTHITLQPNEMLPMIFLLKPFRTKNLQKNLNLP